MNAPRRLGSRPMASRSGGYVSPGTKVTSSRPFDSTSRLASCLASRITLRPGSSIVVPIFSRGLLAAAHARSTTGSNTWPVSTSESQSESNPMSSRPVTSSLSAPVDAEAPPIPTPIRIFMWSSVLESDRKPRVDCQHLTGDVGRGVGREKDRRTSQLVRPAEPPQRNAAYQLGDARLGEERRVALGQKEAGRDRVG